MPARLGKGQHPDFLDEQFTITGKQLLIIIGFAIFFLIFIFMSTPQTYGFL